MAKRMIQDFFEGDQLKTYFLVREKMKGTTKSGKPYLTIDFIDASGKISAKVWDNADEMYDSFQKGDIVAVQGSVDSYRDKLQFRVDNLRPIDERDEKFLDRADLFPHTPFSIDELWEKVVSLIASLKDPHYKALAEKVFLEMDYGKKFKQSAAARDHHHNYVGGLLEHTVSVVTIADFLCGHYGEAIRRDLVICAGLLHDIGKIIEINTSSELNYSIIGSLKGHIQIGIDIAREAAKEIGDFPEAQLLLVEHLILSHQGQKDWGTPIEPKIPEAQLLHMADLTDARMFQMLRAVREDRNQDDPFTERIYAFGRSILKVRDPEELRRWLEIEEEKRE